MAKKSKPSKAPQTPHNQEFRETAIKLALAGDKSIAEVARELELPAWKLYDWVKSWKRKEGKTSNGTGGTATSKGSAEDELRKLQKRNKELEQEVEILKKAAAYFAKTLL
jgi:transposase-like protein